MRVGRARDAAELLLITVDEVYKKAQRDELPQLRRVGGQLRFDMDVLEAWMRGEVDNQGNPVEQEAAS